MKTEDRLGLLLWFRLSRFYNKSIRETNQHLKNGMYLPLQFDVLAQVGGHNRLTQRRAWEEAICYERKCHAPFK